MESIVDTTQQKEINGLVSVRERAASMNGLLPGQSELVKGTTICTTLMLQENEIN